MHVITPSETMPRTAARVESLECLRGCAALIVVAWHLLIGLAPAKVGLFAGISVAHPMIGRLWFAPFNGSAAVIFFFVLSGFVLTWRYFHSGNLSIISLGLLKRWPRLAGPCVVMTLLSWLLFRTGAYHFEAAGALTGSPWLQNFAYGGLSQSAYPNVVSAALQGVFGIFFTGNASLDSSLWTMRPEIIGSIVVFGMAPILHTLRNRWACLFVTVVVAVLLVNAAPYVPPFMAGMLLSRLLAARAVRMPACAAVLAAVAAFYLFSFDGPRGYYGWVGFTGLTDWHFNWILWAPASLLVILVTLGCAPMRLALSGRVGVLLGRLSFPLYLVHVPILCSVGSWVYVLVYGVASARVAAVATVLTVVPLSLLVAAALSRLDGWWVGRLNRMVADLAFMTRRSDAS